MRKPASIAGATRQSAALLAALLPLFHSAPARAEPVTTVEHVAALSLFSVADDALAPAATVRFASGYALSPRLTLQATAALGTAFVPGTQYHPLTTGRTSVDVLEASFGFRVLRTFQVRAPIVPWVSGGVGAGAWAVGCRTRTIDCTLLATLDAFIGQLGVDHRYASVDIGYFVEARAPLTPRCTGDIGPGVPCSRKLLPDPRLGLGLRLQWRGQP
jgi:hypothetical protein